MLDDIGGVLLGIEFRAHMYYICITYILQIRGRGRFLRSQIATLKNWSSSRAASFCGADRDASGNRSLFATGSALLSRSGSGGI